MDIKLSPFFVRVLKCVPEDWADQKKIEKFYAGRHPPPFIENILGKMRGKIFNEKEEEREPISLDFPIRFLSRNGFIEHRLTDFDLEQEDAGLAQYRLSKKGRNYLLTLRKGR